MRFDIGKDRDLTITFDKDRIKNGYCVYHNNVIKHIESYYYKIIDFFGLRIEYNHYNCDDIMHLIIKSTDKFSNTECASEVAKLQIALKRFVDDEQSSFKIKPPFSFSIEGACDPNGNMYNIYYITVKKQWLIDHHLYGIINPLIRNVFIEDYLKNEHKFPKYHKYKTEVIWI